MKVLLILVIAFVIIQSNKEWFQNRQAQVLTHLTIGSAMLKPGITKIITFLQPSSFDSQGMTLVLQQYAHQLQKEHILNISFFDVNCAQQKSLCHQMGISKVPFIFIVNPEGMVEQQIPGQIYNHQKSLNIVQATIKEIKNGNFIKGNEMNKMKIQHLKDFEDKQSIQNKQNPAKEQRKRLVPDYKKINVLLLKHHQGQNLQSENQIKPQINIEQPSLLNDKKIQMSQSVRQTHEIFLDNIKKSREARRAYFIIGSGSIVPILVTIIIVASVIFYLRSILKNTVPITKVYAGKKVFYGRSQNQYEKKERANWQA